MKKLYFYIFLFLAVLPWVVQYFLVYPNGFLESQYELNISLFWEKVKYLEPQLSYGQAVFDYSWISYFIPVTILGAIFGKAYGIIHIAILVGLGFFGFYRLIRDYFAHDINDKNKEIIAALTAFIYITSPSIFLYIKSTIGLTAPAMIFPLQLLLVFYIIENKRKILSILLLFFSFFFIAHSNVTVILLNVGFLVLISWIFFRKKYLETFLSVFIASLPIFLWVIIITFINLKIGYNPDGGVIDSIKEDFYSNQTSILNILKQTADWGFFGGSHGGWYYDFSVFYKYNFIEIVGVIFTTGMLFCIALSKDKRVKIFFIIILFLIAFMLGNKFFLYDYLYQNFIPFHIFRNIQKFAPFLLFLLLSISIYSFRRKHFIIYIILFFGVCYNIPYFLYSNFFTSERVVSAISKDWENTINFLNNNLETGDRIISVPAVYINEIYEFKSGEYLVGMMTDKFTNLKGYRLSPILNGEYFIQKEMGELFIPGNSLNGQVVDISKFEKFIKKFHIPYILVTKDVLQNYEKAQQYIDFFSKKSDYSLIYSNDLHFIFYNKNFHNSLFLNENIKFYKSRYGKYVVDFNFINKEKIIFFESFHPNWKLYLESYSEISCKNPHTKEGQILENSTQKYIIEPRDTFEKISEKFDGKFEVSDIKDLNPGIENEDLKVGQEIILPDENIKRLFATECESEKNIDFIDGIKKLLQKPVFEDNHKLIYDYANSWEIDAEYIKNNFSKEYYKENEDGTIEVRLTLYFKPQSYFYLGILISVITFIVFIGYLGFSYLKEKRKK